MTSRQFEQYIGALNETLFLVFGTGLFVLVIGLIIGFLMYITDNDYLIKNTLKRKVIHRLLSAFNDILRSIPFIILLIMIIPLTRALVGTMLGAKAAVPALVISASPFFARVVYNALKTVSFNTLEALSAMGAKKTTIVRIVFKEALPSLISGFTLTLVTLVGFMSAAAVIGAGGLAFLAYENGKFGQNFELVYLSIITILLLVFIIQLTGDQLSKKFDHTKK